MRSVSLFFVAFFRPCTRRNLISFLRGNAVRLVDNLEKKRWESKMVVNMRNVRILPLLFLKFEAGKFDSNVRTGT